MTAWQASFRARLGTFELDVDVEGDAGVLAVIGPNGCGKTTFLRLLAGALPAERAEVVVAGKTLASTRRGINVPMEQRRIGYVPQGYHLFPHLSVLDNITFGLAMRRPPLTRRERRGKAQHLLDELGCGDLGQRRVAGLSGGEQQRVALARALIVEPELLLLDEPLAALDAVTRRAVRRMMAERLPRLGCPAVLITHDVRDVEALGATVCALEQGRVLQQGSLAAIRKAPATAFIAEFLGSPEPVAATTHTTSRSA